MGWRCDRFGRSELAKLGERAVLAWAAVVHRNKHGRDGAGGGGRDSCIVLDWRCGIGTGHAGPSALVAGLEDSVVLDWCT